MWAEALKVHEPKIRDEGEEQAEPAFLER